MKTTAIVPAAGSGVRLGEATPKQWLEVAGRPLVVHTLERLAACGAVDRIVLVVDDPGRAEAVLGGFDLPKLGPIVPGGVRRQDSVRAGLAAAGDADLVAVHDAARPLVTPDLVARVIEVAVRTGAAVAALRVEDTIKRGDEAGLVRQTIDRSGLWRVQTPQVFRTQWLVEAYARADQEDLAVTDDAGLVEAAGFAVTLVPGEAINFKVTTPEDLALARRLLAGSVRVGHGYDVHRLAEGRRLVLGGVEIPFERGLLGHSDADVMTHAVCDAVLGACGAGDLGRHFPDTDERWQGADSLDLLARVKDIAVDRGCRPIQVDVTLMAEAPRIGPYVEQMKANLGRVLGLPPGEVSVKATTTEGLGIIGRGQGMAALAVVVCREES
ncbi:MAG: 2-C-methyl-D-erythritol 4-phosphate cytidylyltransferase [Proteobacteria bacterium]|nr:2-C-methyl-D-erythritol 4-phosphate cytidylyltransferase [Pseudomonadota bacterium]